MTNDEAAVRELVATWIKANREDDLDTVLDLMTEDVVFLTPGNPPMRGRAAYEAAARSGVAAGRLDVESTIDEITVAGDNAWMITHLRVTVTPAQGGAPIRRAGHTLTILRRENGRWRITRDANLLTLERSGG